MEKSVMTNEALKEYYNQYSLTDEQFENLYNLQQIQENKIKRRNFMTVTFGIAVAASFSLVTFNLTRHVGLAKHEIVSEVAYNHKKGSPMKYSFLSVQEGQPYFDNIDFSMVLPSSLSSEEWKLVGGKKCSVLGVPAAQLRVQNQRNGKYYTWYQAKGVPGTNELLNPFEDISDGIQVKIWQENNIMHVLAGEAN